MKKQKKKTNILPILIPLLSVAAISVVATPLVILSTRKHVTLSFPYQRWARSDQNGEKEYTFNLVEAKTEDQILEISSPVKTVTADTHCHVIKVGETTITKNKTFKQKLKIVRDDEQALVTEDRALFDLTITLKNADGSIVWTDTIHYMSIVYRVD